jgi:hypothetical protein
VSLRLDLATPADDPAIRRLLRTSPIPGSVTVTYEREPDYFLGCSTMGHVCQLIAVRDGDAGEVVGIGSRAIRTLWVNGREEEVGYLSQLRVDRSYQGRWLLSRGFRFLRELDLDGRVEGYLTTITAENHVARRLLVDCARPGYPAYRELCQLHTLALILRTRRLAAGVSEGSGERSEVDLGEIAAFLREHGPAKQFFPAYTEEDFGGDATRGFRAHDFVVVRERGRMAGVLGLWDQRTYKQTVVQGYSGLLRRAGPLYNLGARLAGARPLPACGVPIAHAYASFICVARNDPGVFWALLRRVSGAAARRGYAYVLVGLAETDPLLAVARRFLHLAYRSTLYTACWREKGGFHDRLDGRIPYVEIATL